MRKISFRKFISIFMGMNILLGLSSCKIGTDTSVSSTSDTVFSEEMISMSKEEFEEKYQIDSRQRTIDYTYPREDAVTLCEWFINNPYVEEEDKQKFMLAEEVVSDFPVSISIKYENKGNSFEDKDIKLTYMRFEVERAQQVGLEFEYDIVKRISILWLNDELDEYYELADYFKGVYHFCDYFSEFPSVEDYRNYECEYDWIKKVDALDYEKSAPNEERSKDNYYILDLLIDNYYKYNSKLETSVSKDIVFSASTYENVYEMISIYKQYGNAVFGQEISGEYVIDNYDEMFGELDKMIVEKFDISPEDFR